MEGAWAMETLSLDDMIEFNSDRRIRKRLFMADRIESELVCYEPGQGTVEHHHVEQDEIFYVVEGKGTFIVDGETIPVATGSMLLAPADSKHAIQTADDSRLVVIFFKAPGRGSRKRAAG